MYSNTLIPKVKVSRPILLKNKKRRKRQEYVSIYDVPKRFDFIDFKDIPPPDGKNIKTIPLDGLHPYNSKRNKYRHWKGDDIILIEFYYDYEYLYYKNPNADFYYVFEDLSYIQKYITKIENLNIDFTYETNYELHRKEMKGL